MCEQFSCKKDDIRPDLVWGVLRVIVIDDQLIVMLAPGKNVTPVGKVVGNHRKTVPAQVNMCSSVKRSWHCNACVMIVLCSSVIIICLPLLPIHLHG